MTDLRAIIVAALIVAPVACTHEERPPHGPETGAPGAGAPAPGTTNEPSNVESPKLNESPRQSDPTGAAPVSDDSRTLTTPYKVAQPSAGTSSGGFGGVPGGGAGGSIITGH